MVSRWKDEPPAWVSIQMIVNGIFGQPKGEAEPTWNERENEMKKVMQDAGNGTQKAKLLPPSLKPEEFWGLDKFEDLKVSFDEKEILERNRQARVRMARREHRLPQEATVP